jgi:hypothetical protein
MKRLLLPAMLLACAAACAPAPSNTANTNANISNMNMSNTNASNTNSASAGSYSDADIIAKEREIYDDVKKKDTNAFGAMLDDNFIYVTSDTTSPHDKAWTTKDVGSSTLTDITLADFKVVKIDDDAAVVLYNTDGTMTGSDKKTHSEKARESSVWVKRGGKWVGLFHQDCEVRPPMQPPAGNTNSNSIAGANSNKPATAASPAAATADAEANEKAVWDAIKRGDSNAFGNYLADDAMEVEPEKTYTKAESVSTAPTLGFLSTVTLSDFKTVKIDDDATIVTYTAKGMGPDHKSFTEHHSTVWAKRGGTWKAVFHHGTPVGPSQPPAANK